MFNALRAMLKERRTRRLLRGLQGEPTELSYTAAMYAWRRSGLRDPRAVEPFIQALRHPDSYLREWAAEGLGELGDARAIDPLVEALADPGDSDRSDSMAVRRAAALALAKLGEVDFSALGEIDDPAQGLRRLARCGDPRLLKPLLRCLRDPHNSEVRGDAAAALNKLGDPRAVHALIAATRDSDPEVQSHAHEALGELETGEGLEFLLSEAKRGSHRALMGLGKFGEVRGANAVIELIDRQCWKSEDEYWLLRALGEIGGEVAFQRLRQEVERGEPEAIWPLARTGDPRAVDVLLRRLRDHGAAAIRDSNAVTVEHAAGALAKLGDLRAVEPLIDVLKNNRTPPATAEDFYHADRNRKKVVTRVIKALGDLGDSRAIAEVRKLTKHQPDEIQEEALWALGKLGFEETVADRD